jgi:hypothetical protein
MFLGFVFGQPRRGRSPKFAHVLAARLALSVLSQQIFQNNIVQYRVSQNAFQFGILVRYSTQLRRIRHRHTVI